MEKWDLDRKEKAEAKKKQEENLEIESSLPKCQGSNSKQWTNCKGTYTLPKMATNTLENLKMEKF